eukprot:COSAG06_NODE_6890_length_2727_cov_9.632420_2_plen_104_part_00
MHILSHCAISNASTGYIIRTLEQPQHQCVCVSKLYTRRVNNANVFHGLGPVLGVPHSALRRPNFTGAEGPVSYPVQEPHTHSLEQQCLASTGARATRAALLSS